MILLVVLSGVIVIIIGLFKQATKISMGYQLVNVPGYVIIALGILLALPGILWG